ncbi:MAG: hypothetical protein Q8N51_00800 [Gammaproteobacteria bacterium]|nr:hypothetical protein [Gammaproteobacteria bacterium]
MKLTRMFAGLAALVGMDKAPEPPKGSTRRDFTMPLTLPAKRTAERSRARNSPAKRAERFENRKATIPARVWHKGKVRTAVFTQPRPFRSRYAVVD